MQTDTPVQEYKLKGKTVLVKRDDLMGDGDVLPPWGKLAGIDRLLHRYPNRIEENNPKGIDKDIKLTQKDL